jgi:hypothetical protein
LVTEAAVSHYAAFVVSLIKEFGGDVEATMRILHSGAYGPKKIIPAGLYKMVVRLIKEAIVLSSYEYFMKKEGSLRVTDMTKNMRFKKLDLDRQTIIRVLRRHGIMYNNKP